MLNNIQQYKKIVIRNHDNIGFYFASIVVVVCLFVTLALVADLLRIHIYRPDAAYYVASYDVKLKSEGRWLYYLLFDMTSTVPGKVAVLSNLLFLSLFVYWVSKRWTGRASYAFLLSLLVLQVTPLMESLTWPATGMFSYPLLFLGAVVSPYINVYLFYVLFGVPLFGSSLFYLLPLVHLPLFESHQIGRNLKILSLKIIPAWALGYIVGFVFSLLMVYVLAGQLGIKLSGWRLPNYVSSIQDLSANIINSIHWLQYSLAELFRGYWRTFFMITALLAGFYWVDKEKYIPAAILALGIIVVHYVLMIPAGIVVSFRTSFAAWVGVLVLCFFFPDLKDRQYYFLLPVILFMMISLYRVNHESLKYYYSITNTYHDELVRSTPLRPHQYRGVIFLSSSDEVLKMNTFLERRLRFKPGKMERINADHHFVPVAREAGYKVVIFCNNEHRLEKDPACENVYEAYEAYEASRSANGHFSGLYRIHGQKNGFLIVSLNHELIAQSPY